jgi:hypothetical protein
MQTPEPPASLSSDRAEPPTEPARGSTPATGPAAMRTGNHRTAADARATDGPDETAPDSAGQSPVAPGTESGDS